MGSNLWGGTVTIFRYWLVGLTMAASGALFFLILVTFRDTVEVFQAFWDPVYIGSVDTLCSLLSLSTGWLIVAQIEEQSAQTGWLVAVLAAMASWASIIVGFLSAALYLGAFTESMALLMVMSWITAAVAGALRAYWQQLV